MWIAARGGEKGRAAELYTKKLGFVGVMRSEPSDTEING
jgi:hypothetical protein